VSFDGLPPARPRDGAPLRDFVELVPERQVAAAALSRAREAAKRRGIRPGDPVRARRPLETQLSGAGASSRDPQTLSAMLGGVVGQFGWSAGVTGGTMQARWSQILGEQVAEHATYVSFENGVLTMRASSTAWAQNLTWSVPAMLRNFAEELGDGAVAEIVVLGPGGPGFGRGPKRVKGRGERDTFG
jgi:predicted nucleic acid-binding Zn ribbon protein